MRVVRSQDAAGPLRALDGQAQHAGARGGNYPCSSVAQRSDGRFVVDDGPRLAARVLSVKSRLLDRQRGAETRQHDEVVDVLVRERARGSRELVQADGEGGRVGKVEKLGRGIGFKAPLNAAAPQRDGQTGRDRGEVDRDAGDFVALAVIPQPEAQGVALGDVRRGRRPLARVAHQLRRGRRRAGQFDDRAERQAGHSLREAVPVRERDFHLDQLADIGFDRLVTGRVGAHVSLGVAGDPDPLVGPGEGDVSIICVNGEPVPVADALSVGEQDAGAFRGSQDYRPAGGGLVRRSLGVHGPGDEQQGGEGRQPDEQQWEWRKTP